MAIYPAKPASKMLKIVEIIIPNSNLGDLKDILREQRPLNFWIQPLTGLWVYTQDGEEEARPVENNVLIQILLREESVEKLLDTLEKKFSDTEGFRINLIALAASIPLPSSLKAPHAKSVEDKEDDERVSRQELYGTIEAEIKVTKIYLALIIFSSVVASVGLLGANPVVIIGAMVIAPLIGPFMALSLATTLADRDLAKNALKASFAGLAVVVGLSTALGYIFSVDPSNSEIASRLRVNLVDMILALASGAVGALALTSRASGTLIGVAISVSLLPPLVTFGLMLGSGKILLASSALMLFMVNVICVNLAGTAVFLSQGIKPTTWWDAEKASRSTIMALLLWTSLLIALALIIRIS